MHNSRLLAMYTQMIIGLGSELVCVESSSHPLAAMLDRDSSEREKIDQYKYVPQKLTFFSFEAFEEANVTNNTFEFEWCLNKDQLHCSRLLWFRRCSFPVEIFFISCRLKMASKTGGTVCRSGRGGNGRHRSGPVAHDGAWAMVEPSAAQVAVRSVEWWQGDDMRLERARGWGSQGAERDQQRQRSLG